MDLKGIENLLNVMAKLRNPQGGCPWDLEQTHQSLRPYLIEEAHEMLEAMTVHGPDSAEFIEELGDVLFQVVFHAQLLSERKLADLDSIAQTAAQKFITRHPHVFDQNVAPIKHASDVKNAWEAIKSKTKKNQSSQLPRTESLKSIPNSMPALMRASRLGEKAASQGFDWPDANSVLQKIHEELGEFLEALQQNNNAHAQEEMGDLLFAISQYARKRGWNPEDALNITNQKFLKRYEAMEQATLDQMLDWEKMTLDQREQLYQKVKKNL